MIQLSDYDYPIMLSQSHFIHTFRNMGTEAYIDQEFKIAMFFSDLIKNAVVLEKGDSLQPLLKAMNSVIKGEQIFLKTFALISANWINRMQFINGMKKVFKEKVLVEFTGWDFAQFCGLLCNDFDRSIVIDVLVIYSSKLNVMCEKSEQVSQSSGLFCCLIH